MKVPKDIAGTITSSLDDTPIDKHARWRAEVQELTAHAKLHPVYSHIFFKFCYLGSTC